MHSGCKITHYCAALQRNNVTVLQCCALQLVTTTCMILGIHNGCDAPIISY